MTFLSICSRTVSTALIHQCRGWSYTVRLGILILTRRYKNGHRFPNSLMTKNVKRTSTFRQVTLSSSPFASKMSADQLH